jgi:uncharacterized membrane protein YcaP (DUF421 family)
MLFDNWTEIFRTLFVGVLAYFALLALLRISGKRTLSKMNAYDLVVTVALGSTLATILLSEDVALAEGIVAYLVLIGLQFAIAWLSVRSKAVRELVKGRPQLLFYRGAFLDREMRQERIDREEVLAAIRAQGIADLDGVEAVVLETDGSFTALERSASTQQSTLQDVAGAKARRAQHR